MRNVQYCFVVLGALLGAACGAPAVTPELKTARDAYTSAEAGPAKELAPAELDSARQALEQAESAFEDDPEGDEGKDLAYIAERTADLAAVAGQTEKEKRRKALYKEKLEKLQKNRATMTEAELDRARANLEKERAALKEERELREKEQAMRIAAESKLTAALSSLAEVGKVKEESRGVVITLSGSVLFATGKHELLPIAKEKLNEVATALKDQGYKNVVVEGHTDSRGSDTANEKLSLERAQAVRTHLVSQGMESGTIEAKGLGESRPVATNDTPEGRANNRRVELIVTPE